MSSIDLVYTWVNPDGEDLARERHRLSKLLTGEDHEYRAGDARSRDNGEIRHSISSALRYLPFLRRIYIVGAGGRPSWLPVDSDTLRFVDQADLLPDKVQITFSSDVVEAHIHKVPGLSDRYIYANDDYFFSALHTERDFFTDDGRCVITVSPRFAGLGVTGTYQHMEINSVRALGRCAKPQKVVWPQGTGLKRRLGEQYRAARLGIPLVNTPSHVALPYLRSEWAGFSRTFAPEIKQIEASPFRSDKGFATNFTYVHYLAGRGRAVMALDPRHAYLDRRENAETRRAFAEAVQRGEYSRFCLNDGPAPDGDGWVEFIETLFGEERETA